MKINSDLRGILDRYFNNYSVSKISGGATDANLYRIIIGNKEAYVLKKQFSSLKNDYLNYNWLDGKIPVPKVIFFEQFEQFEFLCVTELKGKTLQDYIDKIEEKEIVILYANSLKQLHSIKTDKKALVQNLEQRILKAKFNAENNLVDIQNLQIENQTIKLLELYRKLESIKPSNEELVFTHGDYCFDNVVFEENNLSGFIDLDNGGVADKYQDIALAVRSIKDNFNDKLVTLFFDEYGLIKVNEDKLEFYTLLDEFF